jgi:hypothetical protein
MKKNGSLLVSQKNDVKVWVRQRGCPYDIISISKTDFSDSRRYEVPHAQLVCPLTY